MMGKLDNSTLIWVCDVTELCKSELLIGDIFPNLDGPKQQDSVVPSKFKFKK